MSSAKEFFSQRKEIAIRLLYTILFLIVFEILKLIVQLCVLFQYVFLLITRNFNEPVRNFSNKVLSYTYRVMRYTTLNENQRPFPFSEFPGDVEQPEEPVQFGAFK
jgi:hypothetical protein